MKTLSALEKHQLSIALRTLRMPDAMLGVMGGPDKKQAVEFLRSIGYNEKQLEKLTK